jgi:16S rRNA (cytidine1402-2'-O)-methyltransferase
LLYLLSSPIGNLQDISQRFIDTLSSLDVLYCEDTRVTGNLLSKLNLKIAMRRFDEQTEIAMTPKVLEDLSQGLRVGLISDAGTPAVSDPGYKLIRECIKVGVKIVNVPGPSAVLSALLVSGLPTDHFMFFGFLPKTEIHIKQILEKMVKINEIQKTSCIFFESPFRILKTLGWITEILPDATLAVCRELTKMHEEVLRGNASEILKTFSSRPGIKGEITVVLSCS